MKFLRELLYMSWWELAACALLLLGTLLFLFVGVVVSLGGFGLATAVLAFSGAFLLGWATCIVGWSCIRFGKNYGSGINRVRATGRRSK